MNQNYLIPILTLLFYISSILGGSNGPVTDSPPTHSQETSIVESNVIGRQGQIITDRVTVRTGPGTQYNAITSLNIGTDVILLDQKDGWYQIRIQDGRTGWVAGYLINITLPDSQEVKAHGKTVMGYYILASQSFDSLIQNSNSLTSIAPWSWSLDSYGNLTGDFDAASLGEVLEFAGNRQLKTYALVHNMFSGSFDSRVISNFINNKYAAKQAVEQIHQTLINWGLSGINLDLENVPAADKDALTEFVAELSRKLQPDGLEITMAVPAKTSDNANSDYTGAYDYAQLSKYVDKLVIMAYDQHYRGGTPGPIASVQWVESVIQYTLSQVPADKIVLGIPNYGYDWPKSGTAQGLTYNQTMQLAASEGANVRWQSNDKVPYFKYGNGHEVWFENRYSIKYKLELVNKYKLNGIALWRLGQEDPGIWQVINDTLK
ncbi:MAG: SH3 domain-containing protein [Firmicutes bacterium]|nr:SH3 domain-containing protein [Bacillota bacterium]